MSRALNRGSGSFRDRCVANRTFQRGFTLLEVLIALAIIAIAMAAVMRASAQSATNAAYLGERTLAHWVAMNKLMEFQLQNTWPSVGETKGTYDMANAEWRWIGAVAATEDEAVRRMDVKVYARDGKEPLAVVIGYIGRPQ